MTMKTKFKLDTAHPFGSTATVEIIGTCPKWQPYVSFKLKTPNAVEVSACIPDKELERFAVNILKALKSKNLKT